MTSAVHLLEFRVRVRSREIDPPDSVWRMSLKKPFPSTKRPTRSLDLRDEKGHGVDRADG